jgi:mono/diheme cytochrome c family protein
MNRLLLVAATVLVAGAGFWRGERLLHARADRATPRPEHSPANAALVAQGYHLFFMNCAHCHGDDARGTDEGPDLTELHKSDARIAFVVRNGIKGEMPRFGSKFNDEDVRKLAAFVRSVEEPDQ